MTAIAFTEIKGKGAKLATIDLDFGVLVDEVNPDELLTNQVQTAASDTATLDADITLPLATTVSNELETLDTTVPMGGAISSNSSESELLVNGSLVNTGLPPIPLEEPAVIG